MSKQDIRDNIITWLKLLASRQEQLHFEAKAAGEIAGDELVEVWFSSYMPDDQIIQEIFSMHELESLNKFHKLFGQYSAKLPTKLMDLHTTKEWELIENCAKQTLQKCAW